ncbi:MAG: fructosamine kinase family protein, partial [Ilumatobacteraceae bacterium]
MTAGLPADLIDGLGVTGATPVSGGDVAQAFRLQTTGGPLFAKTHPAPMPGLFEREAAGLRALRAASVIAVPEVVRERPSGLVLEWIDVGGRTAASEPDLGARLAALHRVTGPHFGGLDDSPGGYLGSQPVDLTPTDDWAEFFLERRVRPLTGRAVELGRIDPAALAEVERIAPQAGERCGPPEPPSLLHGDLWAGNRLVDASGANWLIDPAAYLGHREVDLAMMQLFGGFGDAAYAAYDESFPLADGWRDRTRWYQLPPLLVHAILFGGSYGRAAMDVL